MADTNTNYSEHSVDKPATSFIANHPSMHQIEVISSILNQLKEPNLETEKKKSLISKLNDGNIELWKNQVLLKLQVFTGEFNADFDIREFSAADLEDYPDTVDVVRKFLTRYCFLYNYFYNSVDPHYTQYLDPDLIIPEMIDEILEKSPKFFSKETAENVVIYIFQEQVIKQLKLYHKIMFEHFQQTRQIDLKKDEETSFFELKEKHRDWIEGYEPPKRKFAGTWLRKLFGKLVGADD